MKKFLMQPQQIMEVVNFATWADREARSDLVIGHISGENDYTSNFTGALRRIINSYSQTGLRASSFVLNNASEQKLGCDAAIVLQSNKECKIGLFEAKWPRITKPHYGWDGTQTSKGLSHFTDQLDRQAIALKKFPFAIFEMFYCEADFGKQPSFMMSDGSTCVWHEEAVSFNDGRPNREAIWDNVDLKSFFKPTKKAIGEILAEICFCNKGKPLGFFDVEDMRQEFSLPNNILLIEGGTDLEE